MTAIERQLRVGLAATLLVAALTGGCTSSSNTTARVGPGVAPDNRFKNGAADDVRVAPAPVLSNTDPCAMRLHDLCGALLLYSFENGHLPERLEELAALPGETEALHFDCPVSHQPYIYSYEGIRMVGKQARVIIYDPAPSHSGMRWAVVIDDPRPNKPLVTDVRPLSEEFFLLHPPQAPGAAVAPAVTPAP